jgi:Raf kinase inhibitor-like YbhB/YbcL family protein
MIRSLAVLAALVASLAVASAEPFTVASSDFKDGGTWPAKLVFKGMGCTGENQSPQLSWKGAPVGTRSFAVMIHDADAPTGGPGWTHWVVYNLPATTMSLPSGAGDAVKKSLPPGASMAHTDFGFAGYGGACPPTGDKPHAYIVTVYALKVAHLDIPADATAAYVGFNLNAHKLATAKITGTYGR